MLKRIVKITLMTSVVLLALLVITASVLLLTGNPVTPKMQQTIAQLRQQPVPELVKGQTGYVQNGDVSIWYEARQPVGPVKGHVVLMMGGAGSALMWPEFFLDYLVNHGFQVIRYDYRGVGMSDWMEDWSQETAYDLSDMTADVARILDALYIDKAHLLGISMGGLIARQFALDYPQRTTSLILLSSMGLVNQPDQSIEVSPPIADMLRLALRYGFRDSEADQVRMMIGILAIMNGQSIEPLDVAMYTEQILYDLRKRRGINLAALEQHFHAIRLSGAKLDTITQIALPILVVHGTRDPMIPIESVKTFTRRLQNGRGVWVEGLGHVLSKKRSEHALQAMVEHMSGARVALARMKQGLSE